MLQFSCYYCDAEGEMDVKHDGEEVELSYCPVCSADISDSIKDFLARNTDE